MSSSRAFDIAAFGMKAQKTHSPDKRLAEQNKYACFRSGAVLFLILAFAGSYTASIAQAQGGLTVTPTRIFFEGRKRSDLVTLINTSSIAATYRVSFKNMRMLENGSYEDIEEPGEGELFADPMIRYSPRQVTLEPGASQIIRLLLRKPADLADGEYRSHLMFRTLPSETAEEDIEKPVLEEGELQIQIKTLFAITIPVIARHGELTATMTLSDLELTLPEDTTKRPTLFMRLNRSGNKSVYGDIIVTFVPSSGEEQSVVGLIRGLGVLSPYPTRTVLLPLRIPDGLDFQNGQLQIAYRSSREIGAELLAEAEVNVP